MEKLKTIVNIEEQYKKFPEITKEDVRQLLEWAEKQPHLPRGLSELEMLLFLHSNYCRLEAAKVTVDNYFTCRTHMSMFFHSRDINDENMLTYRDTATITSLPDLTKEGYKVMLVKLIDTNPSKFSLIDGFKLFIMVCDAVIYEEGTSEGHVIVLDLDGVTLGHLTRLSIPAIKNMLYYLQEALPFRLKGLHFINIVPFVDKIVFLMKPFMKKELWDVFFLHSTMNTVYEKIDANVFPKDYPGGKAESLSYFHEKSLNHMIELRDFFLDNEQKRKVDEKLRVIKHKDADEIFGAEGSFKKLDFD